ncbi:MAG TPA: transporter [Desulfobacteraceae bacterium]|nr:transporter [Desulfobacteraceae bacterium]
MPCNSQKISDQGIQFFSPERNTSHGRIISMVGEGRFLESLQLNQMERSFREWADDSHRRDVRLARRRILLIFLLIRYTGAKLNEVLALDLVRDIDGRKSVVTFRAASGDKKSGSRAVHISEALCREIGAALADEDFRKTLRNMLTIDPAFVRRKFYERTLACGFEKKLGGPEMIRKARAVEMMQCNMPLPVVQMILGHSTPNPTSTYVSFSPDDIQQVTRMFMEKESARKTSARNSFFGKIRTIQKGDIQALVELITLGGLRITTFITNDSLQRLGLKTGKLIAAEVKAPWVLLQKGGSKKGCSADNMFRGIVEKITRGRLNTEYLVRIADGTEFCAIVTSESSRRLALAEGDEAWVLFNSYSVILLAE